MSENVLADADNVFTFVSALAKADSFLKAGGNILKIKNAAFAFARSKTYLHLCSPQTRERRVVHLRSKQANK